MSALTERVGRTHYAATIIGTDYVLCACDEEFGGRVHYAEHVAEAAEAAVRAAVAADIRAAIYPEWVHQFSATVREAFGSGVAHAARIAKGKPCSD